MTILPMTRFRMGIGDLSRREVAIARYRHTLQVLHTLCSRPEQKLQCHACAALSRLFEYRTGFRQGKAWGDADRRQTGCRMSGVIRRKFRSKGRKRKILVDVRVRCGLGVLLSRWKAYHEITTKPLDLPRKVARFCCGSSWFALVCNTSML